MVRLLGGDHRGVRDQGEVDARVRHQVGLELCQIDVERSSKRREAVIDDTIWPMRRLRLVYVGRSMSRLFRQIS